MRKTNGSERFDVEMIAMRMLASFFAGFAGGVVVAVVSYFTGS